MVLGFQSHRVRVKATAIRRRFELYECLLVIFCHYLLNLQMLCTQLLIVTDGQIWQLAFHCA